MRLLLDEMYSPDIAVHLRRRGYDVVSAAEREDLAGKSDAEIFELMAAEGRTIVTNDAQDYLELFGWALAAGRDHAGLLLTSDRSLPRTKAGIGAYVRVLDRLLREHPAEDVYGNRLAWLP